MFRKERSLFRCSAKTFTLSTAAELNDGELRVEPYDYNDRDVMFIVDSKVFLKIVHGKLDPVLAFTVGKLKIEGDLGKALEIQRLIKQSK